MDVVIRFKAGLGKSSCWLNTKIRIIWHLRVRLYLYRRARQGSCNLSPKSNSMDKLIEAILKLLPFSAWLEQAGLSKELSAGLSVVFVAALLWWLSTKAKKALQRWELQKTAKVLDPQFDYAAMRQATRYYIPTQFQNASPAREDEPSFTHQHFIRSPLIPFFIKIAFNKKAESERFYLILADSGMGKTTFMVNLYLRYHAFFNNSRRHKMRLFRFSNPDTMTQVAAIKYEEAKDTILLLDALDEDPFIVSKDPAMTDAQAFQKRLDGIIEATRSFAEVVMTCRTQYFPGQEDNPYELKVKRPDERGFYTLKKLYLSPFTLDEVKQYLRKKYGYLPFVHRNKKKRALQVIAQAKHLVMRPMMLSYIDLLVGDPRSFDSNYAIYETLIEEWLKREADKRKYREVDRKVFIENLRKVSEQTALALWNVHQSENRAYLTKAEAVAIAEQNNIPLRPEEVTGQSLLTCDGAGNWKFAHKSVWEFLLAERIFSDTSFSRSFHFVGMDMVKHFVEQKLPGSFVHVEGGIFERGNPKHQVKLGEFWIAKYPVTQAEYMKVTDKPNPSHFRLSENIPVEQVSWLDAVAYCNQLNKQYGFPKTYDKKGNLLDAEGKPTQSIAQVHGFRLPTEAEWEYAARGGNQSLGYEYSGGNELKGLAWYKENSDGKAHPVGQKKPNELGLHDMSGNVWEWCGDWHDEKYYEVCQGKGMEEDPSGPASGSSRVLRGGSWFNFEGYCRTAFRNHSNPDSLNPGSRDFSYGFRLVFVP